MASSWESVAVDGRGMDLYVSLPSGSGPFPAVVVSQHGGGVDQFIRDMADRLAAEGYAAAAPNLFHRITDDMLTDGSRRIQHLSDPDIVADIDATVEFLRNHAAVSGERIGIIGFCMGGRVAWLAALCQPPFQCSGPLLCRQYYGVLGQGNPDPLRADARHPVPGLVPLWRNRRPIHPRPTCEGWTMN